MGFFRIGQDVRVFSAASAGRGRLLSSISGSDAQPTTSIRVDRICRIADLDRRSFRGSRRGLSALAIPIPGLESQSCLSRWALVVVMVSNPPGSILAWIANIGMGWALLKVTGIPWVERQTLESRGEDYREYQRTTNAFFPWFPRRLQ